LLLATEWHFWFDHDNIINVRSTRILSYRQSFNKYENMPNFDQDFNS